MRFFLPLVLFAIHCDAAHAMQIPVRSGEHEGFTRLVLTVPAGATWNVTTGTQSARISVDHPDARFDVSTVFERIPRARILDVQQPNASSNLDLVLGCNCDVTDFRFSPTQVVIDVKDPANPEDTPPTPPLEVIPTETAVEDSGTRPSLALLPAHATGTTRSVSFARKELALNLDRAHLKGLIANPKLTPEPQMLLQGGGEQTSSAQQMRTVTAFDMVSHERAAIETGKTNLKTCPPKSLTDPTVWGIKGPYEAELSKARKALINGMGKIDARAFEKLVKTQIYFGFGAEAESLLNLRADHSPNRAFLLNMARTLDGFRPSPNESFNDLQHCVDGAAMWAILSERSVSTKLDTRSLHRFFAKLPPHLQKLIGPTLGEVLHDAGMTAEAAAIINRTEQKIQESGRLDYVKATIASEKEQSLAPLNEIITTPSDQAPLALSKLALEKKSTKTAAEPLSANLVDSYRTELKNTDQSVELTKATIAAYATAQDFDQAVTKLEEAKGELPAQEWSTSWENLSSIIIAEADDLFFMNFVIQYKDLFATPRHLTAAITAEDRLNSLGFNQIGVQLVQQAPSEPSEGRLELSAPQRPEASAKSGIETRTPASDKTLLSTHRLLASSEDLRIEIERMKNNEPAKSP